MKIVLHGKLRKMFGPSYEMASITPADAIHGLSVQLPEWPKDMLIDVVGFETKELLHAETDAKEIHLIPAMMGGGGVGKIILGVALIVVALWGPFGLAVSWAILAVGVGLVMNGVMQLMYKAPTTSKSEDPPPSKYLGNSTNTTAIGTYRIFAWGRNLIGGHWLSLQVDAKTLIKGRFPTTAPA